jgi:dihydrofolate reductase
MGRKTYETIGKLLPGRVNVIVSTKNLDIPKAIVYNDIDRLMQSFKEPANVFVIGGAQIYGQTIRYVNKLYITRIDAEHEGDIYFPEIKWQQFKKISEDKKGILTFEIYERI